MADVESAPLLRDEDFVAMADMVERWAAELRLAARGPARVKVLAAASKAEKFAAALRVVERSWPK